MAVELEAERLGRPHQPVEMLVDIEYPLVGIEAHGLDEIGGLSGIGHCDPNRREGRKRQAPWGLDQTIARPHRTA